MKQISSRIFFITIVLFVGIILRLLIASIGYTYDVQSYEIVGRIVTAGGNVYKETTRYNYGPLWFIIVGISYYVSKFFSDSFLIFRFIITSLLILVDIGIWYVLYKKKFFFASIIFFLSPISIVLTGYYSQFDNAAVLFGLISVLCLDRSSGEKIEKFFLYGIFFLGISLITKHIFFAFPLWLFFSQKGWKKKFLVLFFPLIMFGVSFLPFISIGFEGIKSNVFLYKSFNNAPLWQSVVPDYFKRYARKEFLFFGSLIIGAIFFRKKKVFEQLLFYTITLVVFSYAIADQYFATVLPFISIYFNVFFLGFTIIQTLFFIMVLQGGEVNWLGFLLDRGNFSFSLQIILLLLGLLYVLYNQYYPKHTIRHLIAGLCIVLSILYGCIIFPSWKEDRRILPISVALAEGNYELANTLYHQIEINPPFAGSRFWYKLSTIRYSIEYYRNYRHINDIYNDPNIEIDWKKVKKDFIVIPFGFPEKEQVQEILARADIELSKKNDVD